MTPKSLLRHPKAISKFDEVGPDTRFQAVLPDLIENKSEVSKVVLCSGKVYYDLIEARKERNLENKIAILRIEQISPFPYNLVSEEVSKYKSAKVIKFLHFLSERKVY